MLCDICPRLCRAERGGSSGEGFCRMGWMPVIARAAAHYWEEPCISGTRGSGTIFFSGCQLGCVFCQNHTIIGGAGRRVTPRGLAELMKRVEALGVHNINLVTPSHFTPAIAEALRIYKPEIPIVWNSSGYERVETLKRLEGLVDIYMPDFKYADPQTAAQLANAPDYFDTALAAIREMRRQTGEPQYDADGLMTRGTLVRHLVLPLRINESIKILDTIHAEIRTPVSLMRQYTPLEGTGIAGLERRLTTREYRRAAEHMQALGLDGYTQGKDAADRGFTPSFNDEESLRLLDGLDE